MNNIKRIINCLFQLFVFTDGEVGNTKAVVDLVKRHAHSHRCFTFGIGEGASSALVNGMAEGGSGHPQFITGSERMQPKVMQSLQFALHPVAKDIAIKWNVAAGMTVNPLSPPVNMLFNLQRVIQYFQLTEQNASNISGSVSLHYTVEDKALENKLGFSMKPKTDGSMLLHRLGARKAIVDLEGKVREGDDKSAKERAVELSIQSGVSSSYTAFIGVNRDNKEPVQGPLLRRNIPVCQPMMLKRCKVQRGMLCSAVLFDKKCRKPAPQALRCMNSPRPPFMQQEDFGRVEYQSARSVGFKVRSIRF
ncbi:von Willebrand factor A domain-containing protein 5A-like [Scleropages formosus]|uniref:von Willebrand factor A domain-containing protein 5A-like n=1 Tax=Scleropages formosus TaxID=113540 RepID=UPI0010FA768A|nr:von Willebrand factor A domain-containing protein 5A-like [Scleropages formosus]